MKSEALGPLMRVGLLLKSLARSSCSPAGCRCQVPGRVCMLGVQWLGLAKLEMVDMGWAGSQGSFSFPHLPEAESLDWRRPRLTGGLPLAESQPGQQPGFCLNKKTVRGLSFSRPLSWSISTDFRCHHRRMRKREFGSCLMVSGTPEVVPSTARLP